MYIKSSLPYSIFQKHWEYLEKELLVKIQDMGDLSEQVQYIISKIASMADVETEEEEDQNEEYYVNKFHKGTDWNTL